MVAPYIVEETEETKTWISQEDADVLCDEIGSFLSAESGKEELKTDQRTSWGLLLAARTELIAEGDSPIVWTERTPVSREVRLIFERLVGPIYKFQPKKAMKLVVDAIKDCGQLDNFNSCYPKT